MSTFGLYHYGTHQTKISNNKKNDQANAEIRKTRTRSNLSVRGMNVGGGEQSARVPSFVGRSPYTSEVMLRSVVGEISGSEI